MGLFKDIEITVRSIGDSVSAAHRHPYFELLYILEGTGIHTINCNHYPYCQGNLFLLTPEETHHFEATKNTRCCIVDFTKELFSKGNRKETNRPEIAEFFVSMEYIFHNHQNLKGHVEMGEEEARLTDTLVMQLVAEKEKSRIYSGIIIQNIVFLLLNLIARIIQENRAGELKHAGTKNIIYEITAYIQQNIYHKENLKIASLAKRFHQTADHLNRNFKLQTGCTLKTYINRYKLGLLETRLRYSDLTISEIAEEMGFTDESHLNKFIRAACGQTAKAYRKNSGKLGE